MTITTFKISLISRKKIQKIIQNNLKYFLLVACLKTKHIKIFQCLILDDKQEFKSPIIYSIFIINSQGLKNSRILIKVRKLREKIIFLIKVYTIILIQFKKFLVPSILRGLMILFSSSFFLLLLLGTIYKLTCNISKKGI